MIYGTDVVFLTNRNSDVWIRNCNNAKVFYCFTKYLEFPMSDSWYISLPALYFNMKFGITDYNVISPLIGNSYKVPTEFQHNQKT